MEIRGYSDLHRKLQPETVKKPVANAGEKILSWLHSYLMRSTPVGRSRPGYVGGRLRSSVTKTVSEAEWKVGTNVEYARFVEYGHAQEVGRFVYAIRRRLVAPWVPPSRVALGTSQRIRDIGAYAYTLQEAQGKIDGWLKELGQAIQMRFG